MSDDDHPFDDHSGHAWAPQPGANPPPPPNQQQAYPLPPPPTHSPPPSTSVPPVQAGGSSRWLVTVIAAIGLLVVALVALTVAGLVVSDGEAVAATISEGDCFADFTVFEAEPGDVAAVGPVEPVDCATAHALETYYVGAAYVGLGDDYPAADLLDDVAITECEKRFERFVDADWEVSQLDFWWLTPSDDGWERGDRGLICLVGESARELTTGSLVGAGR